MKLAEGASADDGDRPSEHRFERLVDAHCAIAAAPPVGDEIGFICSSFVRYTLPHRAMASNILQRRDGDLRVTFMSPPEVGLPYGKVPRLLLIHLTTQALRTRTRDIDLGASMSQFMKSLSTSVTGGRNGSIRPFKSQLLRTLSLTTTLSLLDDRQACLTNAPVVDTFEVHWAVLQTDRRSGLPARVRLGERMFNQMLTSAVPVDLRAVRALQQSVLALDLYFWTTYRAPRVACTHAARIACADLQAQFGAGYKAGSDFKIALRRALAQVQMVYPALRASIGESHFVLHRSPPSVPRRQGP